jgi:hypothetical protein
MWHSLICGAPYYAFAVDSHQFVWLLHASPQRCLPSRPDSRQCPSRRVPILRRRHHQCLGSSFLACWNTIGRSRGGICERTRQQPIDVPPLPGRDPEAPGDAQAGFPPRQHTELTQPPDGLHGAGTAHAGQLGEPVVADLGLIASWCAAGPQQGIGDGVLVRRDQPLAQQLPQAPWRRGQGRMWAWFGCSSVIAEAAPVRRAHKHPRGKKKHLRSGHDVEETAPVRVSVSSASAGCSWPTFTGGLWHFWVPGCGDLRANRRRIDSGSTRYTQCS